MKLFGSSRRVFATVASILLLSMFLAACGGGGTNTGSNTPTNAAKGCTKIGVLLPETATSQRWDFKDRPALIADIKAAIPNATVDYNNAQGSADTQMNQAEADLTKGDCILVVAAVDQDASAAIVAKAKQQGVPVIAYDRLIQSKDLTAYVSFDNVRVGELQGQYIVQHHKKGDNVAMINGAQTDNNALLFKQGALNELQPLFNSGELHLVYQTFTPGWDNPTAENEMEQALTAHQNNIQIAYVANDGMANTVIAALKKQHLDKKVLVTGQDATTTGIQNILLGEQAMTVYKPVKDEAQATANVVKALYDGNAASSVATRTTKTSDGGNIPSLLETPISVDISNVKDTVIKDGYVTLQDACSGLPKGTGGVC